MSTQQQDNTYDWGSGGDSALNMEQLATPGAQDRAGYGAGDKSARRGQAADTPAPPALTPSQTPSGNAVAEPNAPPRQVGHKQDESSAGDDSRIGGTTSAAMVRTQIDAAGSDKHEQPPLQATLVGGGVAGGAAGTTPPPPLRRARAGGDADTGAADGGMPDLPPPIKLSQVGKGESSGSGSGSGARKPSLSIQVATRQEEGEGGEGVGAGSSGDGAGEWGADAPKQPDNGFAEWGDASGGTGAGAGAGGEDGVDSWGTGADAGADAGKSDGGSSGDTGKSDPKKKEKKRVTPISTSGEAGPGWDDAASGATSGTGKAGGKSDSSAAGNSDAGVMAGWSDEVTKSAQGAGNTAQKKVDVRNARPSSAAYLAAARQNGRMAQIMVLDSVGSGSGMSYGAYGRSGVSAVPGQRRSRDTAFPMHGRYARSGAHPAGESRYSGIREEGAMGPDEFVSYDAYGRRRKHRRTAAGRPESLFDSVEGGAAAVLRGSYGVAGTGAGRRSGTGAGGRSRGRAAYDGHGKGFAFSAQSRSDARALYEHLLIEDPAALDEAGEVKEYPTFLERCGGSVAVSALDIGPGTAAASMELLPWELPPGGRTEVPEGSSTSSSSNAAGSAYAASDGHAPRRAALPRRRRWRMTGARRAGSSAIGGMGGLDQGMVEDGSAGTGQALVAYGSSSSSSSSAAGAGTGTRARSVLTAVSQRLGERQAEFSASTDPVGLVEAMTAQSKGTKDVVPAGDNWLSRGSASGGFAGALYGLWNTVGWAVGLGGDGDSGGRQDGDPRESLQGRFESEIGAAQHAGVVEVTDRDDVAGDQEVQVGEHGTDVFDAPRAGAAATSVEGPIRVTVKYEELAGTKRGSAVVLVRDAGAETVGYVRERAALLLGRQGLGFGPALSRRLAVLSDRKARELLKGQEVFGPARYALVPDTVTCHSAEARSRIGVPSMSLLPLSAESTSLQEALQVNTEGLGGSQPSHAALDGLTLAMIRLEQPRSEASEAAARAGSAGQQAQAAGEAEEEGYESWEGDFDDEEEDAVDGMGGGARGRARTMSRSRSRSLSQLRGAGFASATRKYSISVTTFNVLAPCHFRAAKGSKGGAPALALPRGKRRGGAGPDSGALGSSTRRGAQSRREADNPAWWQARADLLCRMILARGGDVVCLQEFWCESEQYQQFVADRLSTTYDIFMKQRTKGKPDGLATLVRRVPVRADGGHVHRILRHFGADFGGVGNRVLHLTELELQPLPSRRGRRGHAGGAAASGTEEASEGEDEDYHQRVGPRRAVVGNVHLTFPHNEHDRRLRYWQALMALYNLERFSAGILGAGATPDGSRPTPLRAGDLEIITGDFNLPAMDGDREGGHPYRIKSDPVYRMLLERGFVSGYRQLERREPLATHVTHRGDYSTADFVFFRVVGKAGAGLRVGGRPGRVISPVQSFDRSLRIDGAGDAPKPGPVSECAGIAEAYARTASLWPFQMDGFELLERPVAGYFAYPAVSLRLERVEDDAYAAEEAAGDGAAAPSDAPQDAYARVSAAIVSELEASDWAHASDHRALSVGILLQELEGHPA